MHVPPLGEVRHEEVVLDEELARRRLVDVEPEARRDVTHHAGPAPGVVVAVPLAHVVEHHAEDE